MKKLLEQEGIDPNLPPPLENTDLRELLSELYRYSKHDIYSLTAQEPTEDKISFLGGRTGYEMSENHVHMDDYIEHYTTPLQLLVTGVSYTAQLVKRLKETFPSVPFHVITSYSEGEYPSCVVRFQKYRADDVGIYEDLEKYGDEAVMLTFVQ